MITSAGDQLRSFLILSSCQPHTTWSDSALLSYWHHTKKPVIDSQLLCCSGPSRTWADNLGNRKGFTISGIYLLGWFNTRKVSLLSNSRFWSVSHQSNSMHRDCILTQLEPPLLLDEHLWALTSRTINGKVTPRGDLRVVKSPHLIAQKIIQFITRCVPMQKCDWAKAQIGGKKKREIWKLRLHWTSDREEMVLAWPVCIYIPAFREQQCSVVLICLSAWGEVSSYTNLWLGDINRSDLLRKIMKSRQGAEMSVRQADRLLHHNLIHPVHVWEDVFDELAT